MLLRAISIDEDKPVPITPTSRIKVSVSTIDGETHELLQRGADTVRQVKKQLQRLAGAPWSLQHLFMVGIDDELSNEQTLFQIKKLSSDTETVKNNPLEFLLLKDFNRFFRLKYIGEHTTGGVWRDTIIKCEIDSSKSFTRLPLTVSLEGSSGSLLVTLHTLGYKLSWSAGSGTIDVQLTTPGTSDPRLLWTGSRDAEDLRIEAKQPEKKRASNKPVVAPVTSLGWAGDDIAAEFASFGHKLLESLDLKDEDWPALMEVLDISAYFGGLSVS